jgi:hypothetical protein
MLIFPSEAKVAITPDDILKLSASQHATCMYTKAELETFPQVKLDTIFEGIKAIGKPGSWRRERSLRQLIGRGRSSRRTKVKI